MIYCFYYSIAPNTAPGNRFLSFLRGFDELGEDVTAVLLYPNKEHYKINCVFKRVKVVYLWREWPIARRILDKIYCGYSFKRFLASLRPGDTVFCYGSPEYVADFVQVKGVRVFHERTESPEVLPLSTQESQDRYLRACKELSGLFVITTSLKFFFVKHGVEENRIRIVNITVDTNRFLHLEKKECKERYIAYCGTVSNNKDGVDDLIKSFAIVVNKHPNVKLLIIGQIPSQTVKAENVKLIDDLGLRDRVVFTGMVTSTEMPQLLKEATVLALARPDSLQAQNGFPTKLGEYLMTGNPVVVTKVGDIPLFLRDGESALLSEQRNPEDFAAKLCWVIENPERASLIGQNGKGVALREFNYLTESKKIIDFIHG